MSLITLIVLLLALAVTLVVAVGLAYLPMRLLMGRMAAGISNFIERQRERRRVVRGSPDRRHT